MDEKGESEMGKGRNGEGEMGGHGERRRGKMGRCTKDRW